MPKVEKYILRNRVRGTDFITGTDKDGSVVRFSGRHFIREIVNESNYLSLIDDEREAREYAIGLMTDSISAMDLKIEAYRDETRNGISKLRGDVWKELYGPGGLESSIKSSITQTADSIVLSVNEMLYGEGGIEESYLSKIEQTAQSITLSVDGKLYGPGGIEESYSSLIQQTAQSITMSVDEKLYGPGGVEESYSSLIQQTAHSIVLSVEAELYGPDGIQQKYTSAIQQYSDQIILTVNGTLNDFENEVYTEVGSIIQQSATDILLQVDGKIVDVKGEITTEYTSAITVAKDEIALAVSGQMSTLEGDITEAYQSAITVAKGEIALTVDGQLTDLEDGITSAYQSAITVAKGEIGLSVSGQLATLEGDITEAYESAITIAKGEISLAVNGQLTDLEDGITQAYESAIVVAKGEINMSVAGQLTTLEGDITAAYESAIDISEGQILSTVGTQITDLDGRITTNTSSITQLSNSIDLSVFTDGKLNAGILIESVNDYEGAIKIAADKIQIDGSTTFADGYNPYAIQTELAQYKADNDATVLGLQSDFSGVQGDIEAIEEFNDGLLYRINGLAYRKNARYISPTEPVLPEGEEFSIGDEWLQEIEVPIEGSTEVTIEYKSFMWFGDEWKPNETKINGARIETGTIDAASIITQSLFSKEIGGVELNVVSGSIGGFTIDNMLVSKNDAGQGLTIDPATRSILLEDMVEGYGASRIAITADGLTPEALISNGGGLGFSATIDSAEYNIRMPGDVLIDSDNTRAGVSFVQYIGKAASNQAQIRSIPPTQTAGFSVNLNTSYTFDLPYSFRIYHDNGSRNGKKNKLHGDLRVSVTATLMGVNSAGVSKSLIAPISMQTVITRSTNETEMFMRPIAFKTSFYSDNSVAVYWKLNISLDGDLAYQEWTSQLFGHYWRTSESRGIDYRACVPKGLSMDASVGLLELTTSGLQFAWSSDRFFRIDGPNEDYFIKSTGKWVHDGTFQLNSSDIVTVDNVSSAIASDLSAYAMKSYVNDGFYNKDESDNRFAQKVNYYDKAASDGRFAKKAGDGAQDFNVKDLIIHGQVNHWLAQQLVVEDARIQVNCRQDGATVDSGLVIYNKDTSAEVSALVYDTNGVWKAGGSRLFTDAYNPKLGGLPAADYALKTWVENSATAYNAARLGGYVAGAYPRKAEAAVITGAWKFESNLLASGNVRIGAVSQSGGYVTKGYIQTFGNGGTGAGYSGIEFNTGAWSHTGVLALYTSDGATPTRYNGIVVDNLGRVAIRKSTGAINADSMPSEALDVTGNGLFTGNLSSPSYASGFAGSGWRLEGDTETHLTIDRLTVRGRMDIYELVVNQIRGTNGALWVSDSAKVASVSGSRLTIDTGGSTSFVPFVVNDLLRCQRWTGKNVKYYVVRVTAVGSNYIDVTLVAGSSPREAGDHLVRMGNTSVGDRQGALYLTSSDSNAPYMDVLDGVNSASFAGKTKVRIGRLDGITDPDLGTLSGYGLYTQNGYFKGKITVTGGNAATKEDLDAVQVGGRNYIPNSALRGTGHNLSGNLIRVNDSGGVILTRTNTTDQARHFCGAFFISNFALGDQITLSAWIRLESGSIPSNSTMFVRFFNSSGGNVQDVITIHLSHISADWVRVTGTGTITNSTIDFSRSIQVAIAIQRPTAPVTIQTKEWKLELGNKATDWTPAPEDVDAGIDSITTRVEDTLGLAALESINQTLITGNKIRTSLLEVTEIVAAGITAQNVEGLTLNFDKGTIGGFTMGPVSLASENEFVRLHKTSGIVVSNAATTNNVFTNNNRVNMYYFSPTDWGLSGRVGGDIVFQLGSTNQIAGSNFDDSRIYTSNWELNKDGSAMFAGGLIKMLADGDTTIGDVHVDAGGAMVVKEGTDNRVLITKENITTLAAIASSTQNATVNNSVLTSYPVAGLSTVNQPNTITVNNNGTQLTVTGTFSLDLWTNAGQRLSEARLSVSVYLRKVGDGRGTGALLSSGWVRVHKSTGEAMRDFLGNESLNKAVIVSAGQYRIVADYDYWIDGPGPNEESYYNAVLNINASSMHALYDGAYQRNEIGKNGIGVIIDGNNYSFFGKEGGMYKAVEKVSNALMYDKPGVLLAAHISSSGEMSSFWGAKYRSGTYRISTGTYRVNHNVGHTNYRILTTAHGLHSIGCVKAKTNTYVDVELRNTSNSIIDAPFDIVFIGNNQ